MKTVLLTGAAGGVAGMIRPLLREAFERVVLSDIREVTDVADGEEFRPAQLFDPAACARICEGVDGIIHLGGFSVEGDWPTINAANIGGCYNLFEAARQAGVGRMVFASSNHAVGFYRRTRRIDTERRTRPDGLYGLSKAFGEALGSLYADKHGMRVMSIRIGNVGDMPLDERRLAIWIHPEDLVQLCRIGLEHPDLHCEIVYGASDNDRAWWDNHVAYGLGYAPKHRSEDHVQHALAEQAKLEHDPVGDLFQGGSFTSNGFAGDLDRL